MIYTEDLGLSFAHAKNELLKPGMLTLHEAGELIRRAALELGFIPISEHQVPSKITESGFRYVDWVWCDPDTRSIVAAFEIEGADCPASTVDKDIDSLGDLDCLFKFVFLYQARKDGVLGCKEAMGTRVTDLRDKGIKAVYDIEMMAGGMKALIHEIKE